MSQVISVVFRNASARRTLLIAAALVTTTGCAHQQETMVAQQQEVQVLKSRLDEAERTNGRLMVRIEELEDDVFLLQDRVDANRIALQRKGIMGPRAHAQNTPQGPGPSPETHWGNSPRYPQQENPYVANERPVTRIPLGGQTQRDDYRYEEQIPTSQANVRGPVAAEEDELVITEKEFDEFEARFGGATSTGQTSSAQKSGKKRSPQPDVTEERLSTTDELDGQEKTASVPTAKKPKDALGTYKDALAAYRSGDYAEALTGFESFLASGPRADYMDNALYWIGECHFGLGQYETAVKYFQRVLTEQPDGNKVPDAMLKMSLAYDRTGRGSDATRLLDDLNRQYPATNAGRLASQKLEERR